RYDAPRRDPDGPALRVQPHPLPHLRPAGGAAGRPRDIARAGGGLEPTRRPVRKIPEGRSEGRVRSSELWSGTTGPACYNEPMNFMETGTRRLLGCAAVLGLMVAGTQVFPAPAFGR